MRGNTVNVGGSVASMTTLVPLNFGYYTYRIVQVSAGYHVCAVYSDDVNAEVHRGVVCWGRNDFGQRGMDSTTTYGSTGGQTGGSIGSTLPVVILPSYSHSPTQSPTQSPLTIHHVLVMSVTTREDKTCLVYETGGLRCFGNCQYGVRGRAECFAGIGPGSMESMVDMDIDMAIVEQVSIGTSHTCALSTLGVLKCWGRDQDGTLGRVTDLSLIHI